MRLRRILRSLCWAVALIAWVSPANAQLTGMVVDADTRAAVADAVVSVRALGWKATTDGKGRFSLGDEAGAASGETLTVAAVGYYIGALTLDDGDDAGMALEVAIEKVPVSDGSSFAFPAIDACERCHADVYTSWAQSAMARAGTNTWVLDIHDGTGTEYGDGGFVYTRDSKFKDHNPNSECASCHQPEVWLQNPGAAVSADDSDPGVMHGISCSVCHRMANIDTHKTNYPGLHPESVTMTLSVGGDATIVQYGPLDDVTFERRNAMRPSYQPQVKSELCAACHQDKNDPDEDGDFEEDNGVVSEPTYQEWVASSYAEVGTEGFRSCADCHMTVRHADSACSEQTPTPPRAEGELRHHTFEGSTPEFLENAVSLSLSAREHGGEIRVEASIHNHRTGHHVPTGVTIRNMILLVEASSVDDDEPLVSTGSQVVHDLGGVGDPAEGYYAGLPGKLYGKINHGEDGKGPVFFTDATGITDDNRIPANATDVTQYAFKAPDDGSDVQVRARLIYRRSWRVLTDAKRWTEDGHGNALADVQPPHFGHLMEEETVRVGAGTDGGCVGSGCGAADASTDASAAGSSQDAGRDAGRDASASARSGDDDDDCACSVPGARGAASTRWVTMLSGMLALGWWRVRRRFGCEPRWMRVSFRNSASRRAT